MKRHEPPQYVKNVPHTKKPDVHTRINERAFAARVVVVLVVLHVLTIIIALLLS